MTSGSRVIAEVGGPADEVAFTVAIYGVDLDPDEVTKMLGCEPTRGHRKGHVRGKSGIAAKTGAWFLERRTKAPGTTEDIATDALAHLPDSLDLWAALGRSFEVQVRFGVFIAGWNQGLDLTPDLVSRLARLGAHWVFDIYADERQEE